MIRRNPFIVAAATLGLAAHANAGAGTVSPALAACSKALIETIAKSETLPAYTVRSPSQFVSDGIDRNAFTVLAHDAKTRQLLAKASCKATPAGEIVSFKPVPVKG